MEEVKRFVFGKPFGFALAELERVVAKVSQFTGKLPIDRDRLRSHRARKPVDLFVAAPLPGQREAGWWRSVSGIGHELDQSDFARRVAEEGFVFFQRFLGGGDGEEELISFRNDECREQQDESGGAKCDSKVHDRGSRLGIESQLCRS